MEKKKNEYISRSEVAYFLHRIVSALVDTTEDKQKRIDIGNLHNDIYMYLEKPFD